MDFDFNEPVLPGFSYGRVFDHVLAEAMPKTLADLAHLVRDFNDQITGLPMPLKPTRLDADRKHWAIGAFSEEIQEFHDANNLQDETDALLDLIYFALGRLIEMGIPIRACFEVIQGANMLKVRGELSKRPGSKGHDAVKPEGWKAPDFSDYLFGITHEEYETIVALRDGTAAVVLRNGPKTTIYNPQILTKDGRAQIINHEPPMPTSWAATDVSTEPKYLPLPSHFEMTDRYVADPAGEMEVHNSFEDWNASRLQLKPITADDINVSKMAGVTEVVVTDGRTGESTTRRVYRDENGNSTAPNKDE